jgi:hypothetical protein
LHSPPKGTLPINLKAAILNLRNSKIKCSDAGLYGLWFVFIGIAASGLSVFIVTSIKIKEWSNFSTGQE